MRKISLLSFAVVIALLACKGKQKGRPSRSTSPIGAIVLEIAKTNVLMGSAVGIAGTRPEQWDRYEALRSKATDTELLALSSDTNAVVRCYAFQALAEKKYFDVYPVVVRHLSDTVTVHTLYGCLGGSEKVGDFMLGKVYSKYSSDMSFHLSPAQRATVDSLLLYGVDNRLDTRDLVISRIDPLERYYIRIRQLATVEKNDTAITALSKYRKQQDIPVIKELLKDPGRQELGFAAAKNFPDRFFYPYLEKALKNKIVSGKTDGLQELYYAIVQYKDQASRQLLKYALGKAKDMQYIYHSDCLNQALREYPSEIYEGIVKPIYTGRPLRQ